MVNGVARPANGCLLWLAEGSQRLLQARKESEATIMDSAQSGVNTGRDRPTNAVFQEAWWLDAVAPTRWDTVEVRKDGVLQAWMPYVSTRGPLGLKKCGMPPLTQTLGPWVAPAPDLAPARQLGRHHRLLTELIEKLPDADYFSQNFHFSAQNTLPFFWAGFETKVNFTYVLDDLTDQEALWRGLHRRVRRDIRKAQKRVVVEQTDDLEAFLRLNDLVFERQGQRAPYSHDFVARLDAAAKARDQRRIFLAADADGHHHAAAYVVFNEDAAYYLMGGSDPAYRQSEAGSLVLWEAIRFAGTVSARFDFEGSMMRAVEPVFRSFGARQQPYYNVSRSSRRLRVLMAGRDMLRALRG